MIYISWRVARSYLALLVLAGCAARPIAATVPAPSAAAASAVAKTTADLEFSVLDAGDPPGVDAVFATAVADPGVPRLRSIGPTQQTIVLGGSAVLAVQGAPDAPVVFSSRDGGRFDQGLSVIRVRADAQGQARVRVHAPPGTVGDVTIFVGSPAAAGTVPLIVTVEHPGSARRARDVSTPDVTSTVLQVEP